MNSFSDVYIKPRCGADFSNPYMSLAEMKNTMLKAIEKEVLEFKNYAVSNDTTHTLTVKGLCAHSEVEIARQIAFIIFNFDAKPLHAFLSVFNSYLKCPKDLLQLCYNIIRDNLTNLPRNPIIAVTEKFNDHAFKDVHKQRHECFTRFFPETYILDDLSIKSTNTEAVAMFNDLLNLMTESTRTKGAFSVLDYSNAVISGSLTDDFVEYPILKHCQSYLAIIDDHISVALQEARDSLLDEVSCRILQLLSWRVRFAKIASQPIFKTSKSRNRPQLREDIVPLLQIHNKWLHKHLIKELFKLLPKGHTVIGQFEAIVDNILYQEGEWTKHNEENDSRLFKVSKKLRKLYGQPKLYENRDQYVQCLKRSELYKNLTLNPDREVSKQIDKLSIDVAAVTEVNLAEDIPEENKLIVIDDNMLKTDRNVTISPAVLSELKVLPVTSYVLQRVLTMLQTDFVAIISQLTSEDNPGEVTVKVTDVLKSLVALCKRSKGFPPAFLNLLELVQNILQNSQNTQR